MKVGRIYTFGDGTFYVRGPDPGVVRTFVRVNLFVYGGWIYFHVVGEDGNMIDQGDYELFYFPKIYKLLCFLRVI